MNRAIGISGRTRGMAAALTAAALFGGATPFIRPVLEHTSAAAGAGYLYLGQAVVLTAAWIAGRVRRTSAEARLARGDAGPLLLGIAAGGLVAPWAFMAGLSLAPAYEVSILLGLEVVFTLVIAVAVRHERLAGRAWAGVGLLVMAGLAAALASALGAGSSGHEAAPVGGAAGTAGVASGMAAHPAIPASSLAGALFVALACLGWAVDNNATAGISGKDPTAIALLKGWIAAIAYLGGTWLLGGAMTLGRSDLAVLLIAGALGYGLSLRLFILAMRHLGAGLASALFSTAPIAGFAASVLFGERPRGGGWIALVLAALGVGLVAVGGHEHRHEHEEITHEHAHDHDEHHDHEHAPGEPGCGDAAGAPAAGRASHRHTHVHTHRRLVHSHPHEADLHHTHEH